MKDLFNEPVLSLNDLLSVWSENNQKASPLFQNFENLAKSKLGIKTELEVGKIYKIMNRNIIFIILENKIYGFLNGVEKTVNWEWVYNQECEQATTEEWVAAIKKECEKRGLKENNFKCLICSFISKYNPYYNQEEDRLWTSHGVIYEKGIFATPIPILTKKEAEEKLNCIIE